MRRFHQNTPTSSFFLRFLPFPRLSGPIHGSGIDNIQKFRKGRSKYEVNQDEGKDKER